MLSPDRTPEAILLEYNRIIDSETTNPERDPLLAICVYLGATVEETQVLLRYSGNQPLYARRRRDAIIWFALKKHEKLRVLDDYLHAHGYKMLRKYK